jgi:hypothetical protein
MKRILLFLFLSFPALSQSYKVSVGSNITSYEFANSAGTNPIALRSESGLALGLSREFSLSKVFVLDLGLAYNQFNTVEIFKTFRSLIPLTSWVFLWV